MNALSRALRASARVAVCVAVLGGALALGCMDETLLPGSNAAAPTILLVQAPEPCVEGSLLHLTGQFTRLDPVRTGLAVSTPAGWIVLPAAAEPVSAEIDFVVTRELVDRLGLGFHDIQVVLLGAAIESSPYGFALNLVREIPVELAQVPFGSVHRNDEAVLSGAGLLAPTEGTVNAVFSGTFTAEDGFYVHVEARLPVLPLERGRRDRGVVRLSTALGGIGPGTFEGSIGLESMLVSGAYSATPSQYTSLDFGRPVLFAVDPTSASLEQVVTVRGAGFVGGADSPDEGTFIRIRGTFTPEGEAPRDLGPSELVLSYVSGNEVRGVIEAEQRGGRLLSVLFGATRGFFSGWANPVVVKGVTEVEGPAVQFNLTLAPVRQVALLRFLPGFYASLARFGLTAAEGVIEARVAERIESIYATWNVDARLEEPTDVSRNGYAVVEVGGPDPNNRGLFGYDNTPGKDVQNVRLYDAIGGANVDAQPDGAPGYGGVFIENFLFFSAHPGLPRPGQGPTQDPLFDEAFDPVRNQAATPAEIRGEGPTERVQAVDRAVRALSSMVGETTAHELGHSLGMAEPFAGPSIFHSTIPGAGCLMDGGGERPLGERIAAPGFAVSHICGSDAQYMDTILGNGPVSAASQDFR